MTGSTPRAAVEPEVQSFRTSLHVVSREFVRYDISAAAVGHEVRVVLGRPIQLRAPHRLTVQARQRFMVLQSGSRQFNAELNGYEYSIDDAVTGHEIAAFHWHRGSINRPHIHVGAGAGSLIPELQTAHIPSGLVALADFVRFLIVDFRVQPLRDDWETLLAGRP